MINILLKMSTQAIMDSLHLLSGTSILHIKSLLSFFEHDQCTKSHHSLRLLLLTIDYVEICAFLESVKVKHVHLI